jgi:hypothetical protein
MAFWNDPASIKPKQLHRWVVSFGEYGSLNQPVNGEKYIPLYLAKSIDLPSYEIGNVQARYLFSYNVNYPKRLAWKPITITLYDAAINAGDQSPQGLLANPANFGYVYKSTDSYTFKDQVNFNLVGNGQIVIKQINPDGSLSDSWKLYSAILSEVKFDRLDYSNEAIQTVTLTINYDDAKLETVANKEDDYVLIDKKYLENLSNLTIKSQAESIRIKEILSAFVGSQRRAGPIE